MMLSKYNLDRMNYLIEILNHANFMYYQEHKSIMTDMEFDMYMKELSSIEKEISYVREDSPTQRVGGEVSLGFKTVYHKNPMLSLENSYSFEELDDFESRVAKEIFKDNSFIPGYVAELKFDGLSLSLHYEEGFLKTAVTRGDGEKGDDVTENVKRIKSIPLKLMNQGYGKNVEIRGEVFMPITSFNTINAKRHTEGKKLLANPRNAASGTLKQLDPKIVAERNLSFFAYQTISEDLDFKNHLESLDFIKSCGFITSPQYRFCSTIEEVKSFIDEKEQIKGNVNFDIDGIVVKVNDIRLREAMGYGSKYPKWATSYKYKPTNKSTRLESIDYQVGRTGNITPVANLSPIYIDGTVVRRSTLHNADEIERLGLKIGHHVFVEKGGEIIPKITGFDNSLEYSDLEEIVFPENCPSCGTKLIRRDGEANHFCPNNKGCYPQIKASIEHFVSRKAMNIEGIGSETISLLVDRGIISSGFDLYKLEEVHLRALEGFGERSISILLDNLNYSKKNTPLDQILYSFGIPLIGSNSSKKLISKFKSLDALMEADPIHIMSLPDFGAKAATSIIEYFNYGEGRKNVQFLKDIGFNLSSEEKVLSSNSLSGKSFIISGTFNKSRDELSSFIENNGGKLVSSVSKTLDYFVKGDKVGPAKIEKANKFPNIKFISEEELLSMV